MRAARLVLLVGCSLGSACSSADEPAVGNITWDAAVVADSGVVGVPDASSGSPGGGDTGTREGGVPGGSAIEASVDKPCEIKVVTPERSIADMLIVLDRSGSMTPALNPTMTDRWGGSRTALIDVTKEFQSKVNFGLMTYPGGAPTGRGPAACTAGELNVPVAPMSAGAIEMALGMMDAAGATPTASSLQEALKVLGAVVATPDQTPVAKYVLLVTDGDPNCSTDRPPRMGEVDDEARMQSLAAVEALRKAGIRTFVVGFQTAGTNFAAQLDAMAAAGGTGTAMHHSVQNGVDLSTTVSEIAAKAVACTYTLDMPVTDPKMVKVTVGGMQRNLGEDANGWKLEADNRTVSLSGVACEDVQIGKTVAVEVTCTVVPVN